MSNEFMAMIAMWLLTSGVTFGVYRTTQQNNVAQIEELRKEIKKTDKTNERIAVVERDQKTLFKLYDKIESSINDFKKEVKEDLKLITEHILGKK